MRKKIRRAQVLEFFSQLPSCVVAMEACGGAHFWGREIGKLGHDVRLIPPAYVKPFVKRQKNDAAAAEAICEAALRPTMRFVPVKSEETQGAAMVFRVRELLIRQRTQAINALRGHLTEFGQIVPQGATNAARLIAIVEDPESDLPADAIPTLKALIAALMHLEAEIAKLDAEIARRAKENDVARRLMTVPGIGPLIATAIAVLAPPAKALAQGLPADAWKTITWREGSNVELTSRFAAVHLRVASRDYNLTQPRPKEWLLVEWPDGDNEPLKYPDARLYKKSPGTGAMLCFVGHALMENRSGLVVQAELTKADGHAERRAALAMIHAHSPGSTRRLTLGADRGYDSADFVRDLRQACVTPHVGQKARHSAIDGRTMRHEGYALSQKHRKRIEEPFGWSKTIGGLAQTVYRGIERVRSRFVLTMAANNLARLPRLLGA